MRSKGYFLTLVACFAFSGCVQLPLGPGDGKKLACGPAGPAGPQCKVLVSVDCVALMFCKIAVDSDTVNVPPGISPVIEWEVVTPGYAFTDNGIAISAGGDEFMCHAQGADRRRFMCNDRHTKPGNYKYTITLTGIPTVLPLDPWIANG
jgi:hypothetical protein